MKREKLRGLNLMIGVVFCFLTYLHPANAQVATSTASINGTVQDVSGAVIPGAKVVLHSVATGEDRTSVTNATGNYVLLNIRPGNYAMRVSKEGFITAEETGITLTVNQTATFNFTLRVGTTRQTVTVRGTAAVLQASTAELGTVVGVQDVTDLPLNGRNFTQLLTLTPGASAVNVSQNAGGGLLSAPGIFTIPAVNGQVNRSNYFMLDGINDNDPQGNEYTIAPTVDDIEEFKVQSHNDQAEFGQVLGGVINVVTKSGTNQFHGAAWEFLRNDAFDARNFFISNVTPLKQNVFGGNIAGPVMLPHYNGQNRTFFFASYEGFREHTAAESLYKVPTPPELTGDLSDVSQQIYNPFTTRPDPNSPGKFLRDPFAGNVIPSSLLDPNAIKYAQTLFPAPVSTGIPGINGLDTLPTVQSDNQYSVRVDEQINPSNSAWFRITRNGTDVKGSGGVTTSLFTKTQAGYNLGVSYLHDFNSSTLLQVSFGRTIYSFLEGTSFTTASHNFAQQLGLSPHWVCGFSYVSGGCLIPNMVINGYLGPGEDVVQNTPPNLWEWKGDLSHIHGKHTLMTGVDITRNNFSAYTGSLSASFTAFQTANPESPGTTGNALASFLLGVPDSASLRNLAETEHGGWVDGAYIQDQWKATDKLTVNLGFRYDVTLIPRYGDDAHQNNTNGDLDLNTGTYLLQRIPPSCSQTGQAPCIPGGTLPSHVALSPIAPRIFHNTYDNLQPRVGFAYRLNERTVLRASAGRVFDNWSAVTQTAQNFSGTWPSVAQFLAQNLNATTVTRTFEDPLGLGTGAQFLPPSTPFNQVQWFANPYIQNPYSDQWNFGIQRQLTANTLLTANYVGSHSSRIDVGTFQNVAVTPGPGSPQSRAPFPYIAPTFYDQSIGRSNYNAFQLSLDKHFSNGLTYLISYTWSKSMDIGCSGYFGVEGCAVEDPYNLDANKSVSAFDLTHALSASWVYELPFGKGKRFASSSRLINDVFGNWQINGILALTSGPPYDVGVSGDIANTGNSGCCSGYYERLNLIGNPSLSHPTPTDWINKAAFAVPPPFTFGDLGRDALRADWTRNLDFSLFREFPIAETKRFEFRVESFNLTNTPIFGIPDRNFSDPTFGEALSASSPRILQFALKFYF